MQAERTAWVFPLLVAGLNAGVGMATTSLGTTNSVATASLWTAIAIHGQLCTTFGARAWLGQVRWTYLLGRN